MFSSSELKQINNKGLDIDTVNYQLACFEKGFPFIKIVNSASISKGILKFSKSEEMNWVKLYEENFSSMNVVKFIPASGAASRMFKSLIELLSVEQNPDKTIPQDNQLDTKQEEIFSRIGFFAFGEDLETALLEEGFELDNLLKEGKYSTIARFILKYPGLNYENLPKALIKFHSYPGFSRTSFEEHLVDAASFIVDKAGVSNLHFTISPEHEVLFVQKLKDVISQYGKKYNVRFNIDFSFQKQATDTIAVDMENKPFRLSDNSLLFRPGGHGALIDNLNELDSDLVFVSNIDNVAPERTKKIILHYKKLLGGVLIHYEQKIFNYLLQLDSPGEPAPELIHELKNFVETDLNIHNEMSVSYNQEEWLEYFRKKLNRPIRVCAMVRNAGEPGGGPFFARNEDGTTSLQIVESSQINLEVAENRIIFENASHFNPVDLVCKLTDYKGSKFDLLQFRDMRTGFISQKSNDGRDLKALELPGLWNGAMSDWNTFFVEVPIETFNPVKTLNDLLRPEHQ